MFTAQLNWWASAFDPFVEEYTILALSIIREQDIERVSGFLFCDSKKQAEREESEIDFGLGYGTDDE